MHIQGLFNQIFALHFINFLLNLSVCVRSGWIRPDPFLIRALAINWAHHRQPTGRRPAAVAIDHGTTVNRRLTGSFFYIYI